MHFTINDIREMAPGVTFARGMQYFHARNARITDYYPDQSRFVAEVQGSGRNHYRVVVNMHHILSGDCSCPVGFDCKHAVAAAMQWLQDYGTESGGTRKPSASALQQWLRELPTASESSESVLATGQHYLLYELSQVKQQLRLGLKKAYLKKDGQWSQITPFSPDYFSLQWSRPAHVLKSDVAILQLLPHMSGYTNCELLGDAGRLALDHMLHTGRLMLGGRQVQRAAPERLILDWVESEGQQQLQLRIEGRSTWLPIATTPAFYLDLARAEAGELISQVAPRQLQHLASMPPVSTAEMPELALRLREVFPQQQVPVPVELPDIEVAGTPLPCLTMLPALLYGNNTARVPVAVLHFEYAGRTVMPLYDRSFRLTENPFRQDDKLIRICRDTEQEDHYCGQLLAAGLIMEQRVDGHNFVWIPQTMAPAALFDFWEQFVAQQVPALRAQG